MTDILRAFEVEKHHVEIELRQLKAQFAETKKKYPDELPASFEDLPSAPLDALGVDRLHGHSFLAGLRMFARIPTALQSVSREPSERKKYIEAMFYHFDDGADDDGCCIAELKRFCADFPDEIAWAKEICEVNEIIVWDQTSPLYEPEVNDAPKLD